MMSNLTLLPPNESKFLKDKEVAFRKVIPDHALQIDFDPMTCNDKLLPYLAQVWQVLYWDESWTAVQKRKMVRDAREIHKHIGTAFAIEKMFEALDMNSRLVEWYEYDGEPYHFFVEVVLEDKPLTPELLKKIHNYIGVYKNVRTQLDYVSLSYEVKKQMHTHGGTVAEVHSDLAMVQLYEIEPQKQMHMHGGVVAEVHVTISNTGGEA